MVTFNALVFDATSNVCGVSPNSNQNSVRHRKFFIVGNSTVIGLNYQGQRMMSINRKPLTSIENILALDSDRNHESIQSFKSPALDAMSTDSNFDKLQEIIDNFVKNPTVAHRANRLIKNLRKQILAFDNSVRVVATVESREITSHKSSTMNTEESSAITATISVQKDRCASRKDKRDICSKIDASKNDHAKMANDVDDEHLDGKQCIRRSNRRASISTPSVVSASYNKSLITQKKVKQPRGTNSVNASLTTDIVTNENEVSRKQLQRQPQFDRGRDLIGSFDRLNHTKRPSYSNLPAVPCVSDYYAEDVMTDGIIKVCQDLTCQSKLTSAEDLSANKENRGAETEFSNNAVAHSNMLHTDSPLKSSPIKDLHPISNIDFFHEECQTPQIKCMPTVVMTEEEKSTIILAMSAVKTIMLDMQPDQELERNSRIRNFVPFKFHIYDTNSNESFIEESGVISSPATISIPYGNDNLHFTYSSSPKGKRSSQRYKFDINGGELKDCNLQPGSQENRGERAISFVPIIKERMLISPIASPSPDSSTEPYISEQVNSSGQVQSQTSDVLTTDVKLPEKSLPSSPKLVRRSATFESFADLKTPLPLTMYSVDAVEVLQQDLLFSADFHEEPMGESCSDVIIVDGPEVTQDSAVKIIPISSPLNACRSQSLGWPTNLTKAFLPGEEGSNVKRQDLHLCPIGCISSNSTENVSDNTIDLDHGDSLLHHVSRFGSGEKQCTECEQLKEVCNSVFVKEEDEEEEGVVNHDEHSESIDDVNDTERSRVPLSADQLVMSSTSINNIQLVSQTPHCDIKGVVVPTIPIEEPTHVHGSLYDINDVHCSQKTIIGSSAAVIQNIYLEESSLSSVEEHHLLHGINGIFSSKAILDWSLKLILTTYNPNNFKAFRSNPGFGFIVALVSLMYNCPIWHPPDTITECSATVSRTHTPALLTTAAALTALTSHMTISKDEMADRYHCVLSPKRHIKSERKVHFCDIDGSSVSTPSPITSHRPIFSASKRLHSLIKGIDHLTAVLLHIDNSDGCTDRATSNCYFDSILSSCELLTKATTAAYISRAMLDQLLIDSKPLEIVAIANLLATELNYVRKLNEQKVSLNASSYLIPSILRHRAAWMATSALRSQLRWLLDPPPQALTAGSGNLYAVPSSPWCTLYKVVTVDDSLQAPSNRRKSIKLDNVLTLKMTLSSLVTQALRQIYDAFIAAADSFLSVGHGTVDNVVTEFLMAAVTVSEDHGSNESNDVTISLALFDGLSESQPQVFR